MLEVENFIIGGTFYGCGLAASLPDAMICESSAVPGGEFSLAFDPGSNYHGHWQTPLAGEFYRQLVGRQALDGDRAALAALTPVLADLLISRQINLHLVSPVVRCQEGVVEVLHADGLSCYRARRIIDARPTVGSVKYLTALVRSGDVLADGSSGDIVWRQSFYPGDYYFTMPFLPQTTYPEARQALLAAWAARPAPLVSATLGLIAVNFDYRLDRNPAAALERGELAAKELR